MILKETLRDIIRLQTAELKDIPIGIPRAQLGKITPDGSFITILTGVRRCGKSTLLHQLINKLDDFYYFNFEDPRAMKFEVDDFGKLDQCFKEELGESQNYFFDEIQNIPEWERIVRRLHDLGKKVIITGSNASLLSRELGDRLTGRHLSYELFPFSYHEFLLLKKQKESKDTFQEYLKNGGFPEYVKNQNIQILHQLFRDIITRDIITRYQIRDPKVLLELAIYLITNVGNEFSYTRLKNQFGLGSVNTVISYISYLEESYLLFTVPRFAYSYTKQRTATKKIYSIDSGLSRANSASVSTDSGRHLENLVFLHLRKKFKDILYYQNKSECDFIVKEQGEVKFAIQVCHQLDDENLQRELNGIKEAVKETAAKEAMIITFDQKDEIEGIPIFPAMDFIE